MGSGTTLAAGFEDVGGDGVGDEVGVEIEAVAGYGLVGDGVADEEPAAVVGVGFVGGAEAAVARGAESRRRAGVVVGRFSEKLPARCRASGTTVLKFWGVIWRRPP